MQVLVGRDATHDRLAHRIVEQLAGVAVRDARRELLERDVDDAVGEARRIGHDAGGDLQHPRPLELAEIDGARHREVVADHDRVATFLGRPPLVPLPPGVVGPEPGRDAVEVVGKVVLGEEVQQQRAPRRFREVRFTRVERFAFDEVATAAPRDHLVGEPLLGGADVAGVLLLRNGSQFAQEAGVVHAVNGTRHGPAERDQPSRQVTGA